MWAGLIFKLSCLLKLNGDQHPRIAIMRFAWLVCSFILHLSMVPICCCWFPKSTEIRIKSNLVTISFALKSMLAIVVLDMIFIFSELLDNCFFENWNCQCTWRCHCCDIEKIQMSWNKFRLHVLSILDVWKLIGFTRFAVTSWHW
jgi:hypothetical protein